MVSPGPANPCLGHFVQRLLVLRFFGVIAYAASAVLLAVPTTLCLIVTVEILYVEQTLVLTHAEHVR
jgi:hypothetical protein